MASCSRGKKKYLLSFTPKAWEKAVTLQVIWPPEPDKSAPCFLAVPESIQKINVKFQLDISVPASIQTFESPLEDTVAAWSLAAAISSRCKCAPASRSRRTFSLRPALAARNRGVWPKRFLRWTEAPCARNSFRTSALRLVAAMCLH